MSEPTVSTSAVVDPALIRVLWLVAAEWFVLNVLGMLNLDHGRLSRITLIATLAYAVGVAMFVARLGTRRPSPWQRAGLLIGPVPLVVIGYKIAAVIKP